MAVPLFPAIITTSLLLSLKAIIHFKIRPYTDKLINELINEIKEKTRDTVIDISKTYFRNFYISAAVDASILLFAFFIFLLFKSSMISITIFSISIIIITARYIVKIVRNTRLILPYFPQIRSFFKDALRFRSLKIAIRTVISDQFNKFYRDNTTAFIRNIHAFGAKIGILKSGYDIQNDLIREFFAVAGEKSIRKTVYPVIAITVFYGTFAFLVKLFIFSLTVNMSITELILYPFRVVIPYFIK